MSQYFIVSGDNRKGPYDLVTLIKKIRNGSLSETAIIEGEGMGTAKPAGQWSSLAEFFNEKKDDRYADSEKFTFHTLALNKALKDGWHFLQQNPVSSIFSGLFVLCILFLLGSIYSVLPLFLNAFGYMTTFVFSYFGLSCHLLFILRVLRGQPADFSFFKNKLKTLYKPLLSLSLLVSIPSMIGIFIMTNWEQLSLSDQTSMIIAFMGLIIFVIPGLYTLTLCAFAPLLLLDQDYSLEDAMRTSIKAVIKNGLGNSSVIYTLFIINFLAGVMALIPMAISLPITMYALCEFYEDFYG